MQVVRLNKKGDLMHSKPCVDCNSIFKACMILGITFDIKHINENSELVDFDFKSTHVCHTHTF
jgi:hypothetical protein